MLREANIRAQHYVREVQKDAPIAFWPLWENVAQAIDQSASGGHHCTYNGGYIQGKPGPIIGGGPGCMSLDGTTGYVSRTEAVNSVFYGMTAMSTEAWVNAVALDATGTYPNWNTAFSSNSYNGYIQGYGTSWHYGFKGTDNVFYEAVSATGYTTGVWHHLVGTYDGANLRLYVDNVLAATAATTVTSNIGQSGTGIGYSFVDSPTYWNGSLAFIAAYNYALSPGRIAAHYRIVKGLLIQRRRMMGSAITIAAPPTKTLYRHRRLY